MTFSIGRAGLDVTLDNPGKVTDTGDKVTFEQQAQTCSSLNDFRFLQWQLLGMKDNPDEPFVPVVWSDDPSFTGYYRVTNVEVGLVVPSLVSFTFPWKVELERVPQFAQPSMQLLSVGSLRTNAAGITSGTEIDFYGLPNTTWTPLSGSGAPGGFSANENRTLNGSTQFWFNGVAGSNRGSQVGIPPADFYTGAARLEWSLDGGSTWRAFTGRSLPNVPYAVRIINDLVTARFASSSSLDLTFTSYNGSSYGTGKTWRPAAGAGLTTYPGTWASVVVMRNSPSGVSLRFTRGVDSGTGAPYTPYTFDMTLRPGACFIACQATDTTTIQAIKRTTNEAGTNITGGIRATANDATSGHRYVLSTPVAFTTDTTVGAIRQNASGSAWPFMIGAEINGSAATGKATAQNVVYQYHAATSQTLRIVGT